MKSSVYLQLFLVVASLVLLVYVKVNEPPRIEIPIEMRVSGAGGDVIASGEDEEEEPEAVKSKSKAEAELPPSRQAPEQQVDKPAPAQAIETSYQGTNPPISGAPANETSY